MYNIHTTYYIYYRIKQCILRHIGPTHLVCLMSSSDTMLRRFAWCQRLSEVILCLTINTSKEIIPIAIPDELAQYYLSWDHSSKRRSNQHFGIRHTSTVLNTQTYTNQTWYAPPTNHEQIGPNHLLLNDMLYKEKTPYEILYVLCTYKVRQIICI